MQEHGTWCAWGGATACLHARHGNWQLYNHCRWCCRLCAARGDELTLRAICDSFGVVVHIVTSEQHNWWGVPGGAVHHLHERMQLSWQLSGACVSPQPPPPHIAFTQVPQVRAGQVEQVQQGGVSHVSSSLSVTHGAYNTHRGHAVAALTAPLRARAACRYIAPIHYNSLRRQKSIGRALSIQMPSLGRRQAA